MDRVRSLALGSILLAGLGCANNDQSLLILHNQAIDPMVGCIVSGDESGAFRSEGTLDVFNTKRYVFTPVLHNAATLNPGMPNDNIHTILLQGADVEIVPINTAASHDLITAMKGGSAACPADQRLTQRHRYFSGSIPAGGSSGILFDLLAPDQVACIAASLTQETQVVARITVSGEIDSGDITSPTFDYPITLCSECLRRDFPDCRTIPEEYEISAGNPCNLFQDSRVDCCADGATIFCPAVKISM